MTFHSAEVKAQIREAEGVRVNDQGQQIVYPDSKGLPTSGVGNRVFDGTPIGTVIADLEVEAKFNENFDAAVADVADILSGPISRPRTKRPDITLGEQPQEVKDVLVRMRFQHDDAAGIRKYEDFFTALANRDYELAAQHMLNSDWFRIDSPDRAAMEAEIIASLALPESLPEAEAAPVAPAPEPAPPRPSDASIEPSGPIQAADIMLAKFEGVRNDAYRDTAGVLTVGRGHKVVPEDGIKEGDIISPARIEKLWRQDILIAKNDAKALANKFKIGKQPAEVKNILIQMAFQLGKTRLGNSEIGFTKMFAALKDKDYNKAADEMLDSDWARQMQAAGSPRARILAGFMRSVGDEQQDLSGQAPEAVPESPQREQPEPLQLELVEPNPPSRNPKSVRPNNQPKRTGGALQIPMAMS